MREILFRGKRIDNGEWVEGYYCRAFRWAGDKEPVPAIQENDSFMFRAIDLETIGQYTGLTDKNGKKIFEGDIVKDKFLFGVVKYASANDGFDGMCGFMVDDIDDGLQDYNGFWHQVEIIGNIHDNPELLRI